MFGGTEFGAVGPYERLHGTVFGELDPMHPLNAEIVNLDRAARNARGNVEYRSEFRILKPLDLDRVNGCLVYDVPNRGNQPIMPRLRQLLRPDDVLSASLQFSRSLCAVPATGRSR